MPSWPREQARRLLILTQCIPLPREILREQPYPTREVLQWAAIPRDRLRATGLWKQTGVDFISPICILQPNVIHVPGQCPCIETDGIYTKIVTTELGNGVLTR